MNKEILLVLGFPAAGKSTLVKKYTDQGYTRFNRDLIGGSLDNATVLVATHFSLKNNPVVLDNTYPSVKSRASIIKLGKDLKIPVRCIHLTTSFEDAQLNACLRMVQKTGQLLQDFKAVHDPNLFPPAALYHYRKEFQEPTKAEGFTSIEKVPFVRKFDSRYANKALILDYDGTLRLSTGKQKYPQDPSEIQILPNRREVLYKYAKDGYLLLGASNQSGIARGTPLEMVEKCFAQTNLLLGVNILVKYCPHRIPPVVCYCRKPSPGIGAFFIETYKLDPSKCIMVGDMTSDKTFAERCGFNYQPAEEFFL